MCVHVHAFVQVVRARVCDVCAPAPACVCVQLNAIRTSLASIARTSTGYSLVQPHLDRTRLCDLPDSQLSPQYVRQVVVPRAHQAQRLACVYACACALHLPPKHREQQRCSKMSMKR